MNKLSTIFTSDVIEYYKNNQDKITQELLDCLRSQGNEGKELALEILSMPTDDENYSLDAYGNRVSFLGDRQIKKPFTRFKLAPIHISEIKRCSEDIEYFKNNYIKIKTKTGINFPDVRDYQNEFLKVLDGPDESIVALLSRQCVNGNTEIVVNGEQTTIESLFNECE